MSHVALDIKVAHFNVGVNSNLLFYFICNLFAGALLWWDSFSVNNLFAGALLWWDSSQA